METLPVDDHRIFVRSEVIGAFDGRILAYRGGEVDVRNMFKSLRQPVFADLVKFDLIQATGLVQIEELVRNALAKLCHVIG